MRRLAIWVALLASWMIAVRPASAGGPKALAGVRRIVFLGDSITYSGQYIEDIEAVLRAVDPALRCEFLDLGLPSETVSGLTEPGHAGGNFPRPDLHERLGRVLEKAKPDLVVASYGMNDGIYYPFAEDRFAKYQAGIRRLRHRAESAGARVLFLTPPVFDSVPIRSKTLPAGLAEYRQPFEGYDVVLERYSTWLFARKADGWDVVDIHAPMKRYLDEHRRDDPSFRLARDGVHLDETGHWLIAREIIRHWGVAGGDAPSIERALASRPRGPEILAQVRRKQRLLKDAWLTAAGHKRPGMKAGLPLEEAERRATEIDAEIRTIASPKP